MSSRVAIIGGGLAGIAAAIQLIEAGYAPIIIESRRRLGGRANSFIDPRSDEVIDNCQHVLLGCCTNLIDLYDRLGVLDLIEWHRSLFWTPGNNEIDEIKAGWIPAPLHLASSFRKMKLLNRKDKKSIRRAMWRMIRTGSKSRMHWMSRTFEDFLKETNQSGSAIESFWSPIVVSACNLSVQIVCAAHAIKVFQDGFLAHRWSYTMGIPRVPLGALYEPVTNIIEDAGGEVRLGCSAKSISYDGVRVSGVVTDDDFIEASAIIAAVPFDRLDKLISQPLRKADQRLHNLNKLSVSPILGVHLWFDQQIMDLPHLVFVGAGVQWLFNKGITEKGEQHIHAVISAADEWMNLKEEEIVSRVVADVHKAVPQSVGLEPIRVRAIKEKRATFAATPESEQYRPSSAPTYVGVHGGGVENLFLAGDWTDTGWPATMEGAVRSGYAAAHALSGQGSINADIPPGIISRWLGLH